MGVVTRRHLKRSFLQTAMTKKGRQLVIRQFLANGHVHRYISSPVRLLIIILCNVRVPTQMIEIFGNVLRHLVGWPSVDIQVNFLTDIVYSQVTPPSGELNTRG